MPPTDGLSVSTKTHPQVSRHYSLFSETLTAEINFSLARFTPCFFPLTYYDTEIIIITGSWIYLQYSRDKSTCRYSTVLFHTPSLIETFKLYIHVFYTYMQICIPNCNTVRTWRNYKRPNNSNDTNQLQRL